MAICRSLTVKGVPCRAPAKHNSDFCGPHNPSPEARAAFRAGQIKGGKSKKITHAPRLIEIDFTRPDSMRAAIAQEMSIMVRTNPAEPKTVHALCDGARTIMLIEERTTLKGQLDAVLRFIAAQRAISPTPQEVDNLLRVSREQDAEAAKRQQLRSGGKPDSAPKLDKPGNDPDLAQDGTESGVRGGDVDREE